MNKKEFKKWVDEIVREYSADFKVECLDFPTQGKIILVDANTAQTGMSKCDVGQFDYRTGIAIAYADLRGMEVPTVEENEEEPKFERLARKKIYWKVYFRKRKSIAKKINFLLKLERLQDVYCPDYTPNWNNHALKYSILYNHACNKYTFDIYMNCRAETNVYFPTEEIAQKVCDELNKELI